MPNISLEILFEVVSNEYNNVALLSKVKTQRNIFEDKIEYFGLSGDIAGTIVSKLNNDFVGIENGKVKTTIKNILSINEIPVNKQMNDVVRSGSDFYFVGNHLFKTSSDEKNRNLIYRLLFIYINRIMDSFLQSKIFSINSFENELRSYLEEINKKLKKYMRSYNLTYEVNRKERTVEIYLMENFNKMIHKISFVIDMK